MNWSHFALWDLNKMDSSPLLLSCRKWDSLPMLAAFSEVFAFPITSGSWFAHDGFALAHLGSPPLDLFSFCSAWSRDGTQPLLFGFPPNPKHNFNDCLKWSCHCSNVNTLRLNNECPCPNSPAPEFLTDPLSLWEISSSHHTPAYTQTFPHISASPFPGVLPKSPQGRLILPTLLFRTN